MRYSALRCMNFEDPVIRTDDVLQGIRSEGAESYREEVEELLESHAAALSLYACWREVPVKAVDEESVELCSCRIHDAYLAGRLRGIRTIKVFLCGIRDAMWEVAGTLTDPLEKYLFQYVMGAGFNRAFREICIDMTRSMPKGAKLFMDNPGIDGGWDKKHQDTLMDLLFVGEEDMDRPDNPFLFSGIVYTSNLEDSTRKNIRYMTGDQLVSILYQTAGILPAREI